MDRHTESSDDEEGIALPPGYPYHDYDDIANRIYHCEIEEIPSFRYMSLSQRISDVAFDAEEEQPSNTAAVPKVDIPTSSHTSPYQRMPHPYVRQKGVGLPFFRRIVKEDEPASLPPVPRPRDRADLDVDSIIQRLLQVRTEPLFEGEIKCLCLVAMDIFLQQPMLLELEAPIKIVGDIHGQYGDLIQIFEYGGFPPQANYLFLGNYVDMGRQSIETVCLLLAFKIKFPENFFLLRGNHESASQSRIYGLYDECKRRSSIRLWKIFTDCFNCLPVAAVVDDKVFCVHGGLSPELRSFDQIKCIRRPTDVPECGLLCDLLWSDPSRDTERWGMTANGVSYTYGADIIAEFLQKHDLDLICRGKQVVEDGYEFFADRQLVTLFSAPAFSGDNAGAMMNVDDTLMCTFQVLRLVPRKKVFPWPWPKQ